MPFPWEDLLIGLVFSGLLYLLFVGVPYMNHRVLLRYYRRLWAEEDEKKGRK